MEMNQIFPPEAVAWLLRYGIFCLIVGLTVLLLALALRPFLLWFTGRSEVLDRLKRIEDTDRKTLLELEILNKTLSIPIKKAQQKAKATERAEEPMVVSQEAKDAFLKVLEKSRTRIQEEEE